MIEANHEFQSSATHYQRKGLQFRIFGIGYGGKNSRQRHLMSRKLLGEYLNPNISDCTQDEKNQQERSSRVYKIMSDALQEEQVRNQQESSVETNNIQSAFRFKNTGAAEGRLLGSKILESKGERLPQMQSPLIDTGQQELDQPFE